MSMAYPGITHCSECGGKINGLGRCESCVSKSEGNSSEQVGKYKLIDVLNKIANGELKEGTKIKVLRDSDEYILTEYRGLVDENGKDIFEIYNLKALNEEVELIEPHQFCEDTKMIEELDVVKCEPMLYNSHAIMGMITENRNKLNEVIRKINKGDNNE